MTYEVLCYLEKKIFQLTSSRRGWQLAEFYQLTHKNFNSHPHEEDDHHIPKSQDRIGAFQLTSSRRGWLYRTGSLGHYSVISTHILTKRMTEKPLPGIRKEHISTHILTKRMTVSLSTYTSYIEISTHILTKRMTVVVISHQFTITFQLTSSRRGWHPGHLMALVDSIYFNSHPHEEDDYGSLMLF